MRNMLDYVVVINASSVVYRFFQVPLKWIKAYFLDESN